MFDFSIKKKAIKFYLIVENFVPTGRKGIARG